MKDANPHFLYITDWSDLNLDFLALDVADDTDDADSGSDVVDRDEGMSLIRLC